MSYFYRPKQRVFLWRRLAISINILAILCFVLFFLVFSLSHDNSTRIRNALVASINTPEELAWSPDNGPESFSIDRFKVPRRFQEIASEIIKSHQEGVLSNLEKSKLIIRHLVSKRRSRKAIQSGDTFYTYKEIMNGNGYCADYARVFTAISVAMDVPVRMWGFGFDGFGGGHAFNEIYDYSLEKWAIRARAAIF